MDIPTYIRPWMFDFSNQARSLNLEMNSISKSPYDAAVPGTGSVLDQFEDLVYLMSGNWYGRAGVTEGFMRMFVPFPSSMDATHNAALADMYPATTSLISPSPNSDSSLDASSVPDTGSSTYGGIPRLRTDKVFYVWPMGITMNKGPASVVRVPFTLSFIEVQDAVKI